MLKVRYQASSTGIRCGYLSLLMSPLAGFLKHLILEIAQDTGIDGVESSLLIVQTYFNIASMFLEVALSCFGKDSGVTKF